MVVLAFVEVRIAFVNPRFHFHVKNEISNYNIEISNAYNCEIDAVSVQSGCWLSVKSNPLTLSSWFISSSSAICAISCYMVLHWRWSCNLCKPIHYSCYRPPAEVTPRLSNPTMQWNHPIDSWHYNRLLPIWWTFQLPGMYPSFRICHSFSRVILKLG